ncbi:hypothetical protein [Oceanospirillum maris]|jgi:hypothetical protein|nr:hypothetical protein [Oceanospirillum maris]
MMAVARRYQKKPGKYGLPGQKLSGQQGVEVTGVDHLSIHSKQA